MTCTRTNTDSRHVPICKRREEEGKKYLKSSNGRGGRFVQEEKLKAEREKDRGLFYF